MTAMNAPTDLRSLLDALDHGSYRARRQAAGAFVALGHGAVDPLLRLLRSGPPRARMEAARTLGELGDQRAFSDLLTTAATDDPRVAARAVGALGRLHNPGAAYALLAALDHASGDVRYEAALALALLRVPGMRTHLETRLEVETGVTSWGMPVAEGFRQALEPLPV